MRSEVWMIGVIGVAGVCVAAGVAAEREREVDCARKKARRKQRKRMEALAKDEAKLKKKARKAARRYERELNARATALADAWSAHEWGVCDRLSSLAEQLRAESALSAPSSTAPGDDGRAQDLATLAAKLDAVRVRSEERAVCLKRFKPAAQLSFEPQALSFTEASIKRRRRVQAAALQASRKASADMWLGALGAALTPLAHSMGIEDVDI